MENQEFKFIEIDDYLKLNSIKDLSQEQKDEIRRVRALEYMPFEMYKMLREQKVIVSTQKLKKPRSLFVEEDGKIVYWNHYYQKFNYCSFFPNETEE